MPISSGPGQETRGRASLAFLLAMLVVASVALAVLVQQRSVQRARPLSASVFVAGGQELASGGIKLDLNRAGEAELALLPGVGPALAKKLVDYRQRHGPFGSLDDAMAVDGIGAKLVDRWRAYAVAESAK